MWDINKGKCTCIILIGPCQLKDILCSQGNVDDYINKKKHKKHKKHKKKHHREDGQSFSSEALESDSGMVLKPPQLKLKIKLGGQTLGTKRSVLLKTFVFCLIAVHC